MKRHILGLSLLFLTLPATTLADDAKLTGVLTITLTAQRPSLHSARIHDPRPTWINPTPAEQRRINTQKRKNRAYALRKASTATPAEIHTLGHDLYMRKQVANDEDVGLELLARAAKADDASAELELIDIYTRRFDKKNAILWATRRAETGGAVDWRRLGDLYAAVQGSSRDMPRAIIWYKRAADAGDVSAQITLGYIFERGKDVPRDIKQAIYWYERAAATDNEAMLNLAELYDKDTEVHDSRAALQWYIRALEAHNLNAVGPVCQDQTKSDLHAQAMRTCQAAYDSSMQLPPYSQAALGIANFKGDGVPQDYARAAKLLFNTTDQMPEAAYDMGVMLTEGLGVPADFATGSDLIVYASVRGNANAKAWLARHPEAKASQLDITQAVPDMAKDLTEALISQTQTAYPERAMDNEVEGRTLLRCFWGVKGVLETCKSLEETPKGYGFAKATTRLLLQPLPKPSTPDWVARSAGKSSLIQVIWTLN